MQNDPLFLATVGIVVAVAALYGYGSYWAFRIREVLFDRLYRERAQRAGTAGVFFSVLAGSYLLVLIIGTGNFYLTFAQYLVDDLAAIVTFAWVDSTVIMMRRLDPLRRDSLHWTRFRIVIWAFVVIATVGGLVSALLGNLFASQTGTASPTSGQGVLLTGPFGFSWIGLIAIVRSWRRSKQMILRGHLKWFMLYLLAIWIASAATGGTYLASIPILGVVSALSLATGAFFLYRSAKSLAPVNRLEPANLVKVENPTPNS